MTKIALITGGSSGIGAGTALALARRGVASIVTFNANEAGACDTVTRIEEAGASATALPLDLARSESFAAFHDTVARTLFDTWQADRLDYLVNNAGFGQMCAFVETDEALLDSFYRVPEPAAGALLTQALLPLLADGGAIVNVTSNSALPNGLSPGYSAYASMKGGLATLTRYLAKELGDRRIRVNAIAPGPTRTRIAHDAFDKYPEVIPPIVEKTTLGRIGDGDDVGAACAALLTDDFRWTTGQEVEVSGGFNL